MQTITLPIYDTDMRVSAAHFVAELVRQGVGFHAVNSRDDTEIVITFTGAF